MAQAIPIGVNLGRDHLTSAYIDSSNEGVTVFSIETSAEWKEFFFETLNHMRGSDAREDAEKPEVVKIVTTALTDIRDATRKQLDKYSDIYAITFPEHFKQTAYHSLFWAAATAACPKMNSFYFQTSCYLRQIRTAYGGLDTAEALGYTPGANLDDLDACLLYFDYIQEYLEVSLMNITKDINDRIGLLRMVGFGGPNMNASQVEITNLAKRFKTFIIEEPDRRPEQEQVPLDDFRFVIFSGEAPRSEFQKIRGVIEDVVPEISARVLDKIDPFWVATVGAALQAKARQANPNLWDADLVSHCSAEPRSPRMYGSGPPSPQSPD